MSSEVRLPTMHERTHIMQKSKLKLMSFMNSLSVEFDLTASEQFVLLSDEISRLAQSCVSTEREHDSLPEDMS